MILELKLHPKTYIVTVHRRYCEAFVVKKSVKCQMKFEFLVIQIFLQSGEASRWKVCYQRGLPRLVSLEKHGVKFQLPRSTPFGFRAFQSSRRPGFCYLTLTLS